jgi:hypothetical protein
MEKNGAYEIKITIPERIGNMYLHKLCSERSLTRG